MAIFRVILSNAAQHAPIENFVNADDRIQALNHVLDTLEKSADDYAVILVTPIDALATTAKDCAKLNRNKFVFDGDQLQDYKITDKPRKRYLQAVTIDVDTGHNELVTICLPESFIDEMRQRFDEAMGATRNAN